mmetsp:Transcript_579/g.649  ORF Transcript_579/g.649 Transcript_579/m.649 type:complete len:152 (-) Transcript_579:719-1174(-)
MTDHKPLLGIDRKLEAPSRTATSCLSQRSSSTFKNTYVPRRTRGALLFTAHGPAWLQVLQLEGGRRRHQGVQQEPCIFVDVATGKCWESELQAIPVYYAQSNSKVERLHRTLANRERRREGPVRWPSSRGRGGSSTTSMMGTGSPCATSVT